MSSKPRTARHARRWGFGVGVAGAAVTAAMIGVASAPVGRADTPDDVLGPSHSRLGASGPGVRAGPQASLDAHQIAALTPEENLIATSESFTSSLEADQAGLPAADQAGLAEADLAVLQADKGILDAAQGFLAADQAGELANWASGLPTDFATLDAEFGCGWRRPQRGRRRVSAPSSSMP